MFPGHPRESSEWQREVKQLLYLFAASLWIVLAFLPKTVRAQTSVPDAIKLPSGLSYRDQAIGSGPEVVKGSLVTVHYSGILTNGKAFDESHNEKDPPFVFVEGVSAMIPGWSEGLLGMQVGGRRQLIIPSSLAYGTDGVRGAIPAGATLIYDVTVVKIE